MNRSLQILMLGVMIGGMGLRARADDTATPPIPSKHQLMKECMAKQKASDGGIPKEDMKRNCKDVTKTQRENDKVEKESTTAAPQPPSHE